MADAPSPQDIKVRENRLRRMATRQSKVLTRSRVRDPYATDYGVYFINDQRIGDLDAVEAHLKGQRHA